MKNSTKLAATLGALALGTALCALPAFAQDYRTGRNLNDNGSFTSDNSGVKTGQIGPRAPKTGSMDRNSGRGVYNYSANDGGQGLAPAQGKYSVGRGMNDGGISAEQFNKGEEKTGSASTREQVRSLNGSYAYGPQGQPSQTR
jgi:hypothetical protein